MSELRVYVLDSLAQRELAADFCMHAPEGAVCTFDAERQTPLQQRKYHAQINDIAACVPFMGEMISAEDWKRLLIDGFVRVMRDQAIAENKSDPFPHHGRLVPSLDGKGTVYLGVQSRKFGKQMASEFVEYLYAWGTWNNVKWKEYEEYRSESAGAPIAHGNSAESYC